MVQFLDLVILSSLLLLKLLLLFLSLLTESLILGDVMMQVLLIILKLESTVLERLVSAFLLFFELFDLLLDRVVGKLGQEHLFLLFDELIGILSALLSWELHSAPGNVHRPVNVILLLDVIIRLLVVTLGR